VAEHDERHPTLAADPCQELQHYVAGRGIEAGGRLVQDGHVGSTGQGHGEEHEPPLAARQLTGVALRRPRPEPNVGQQLVGAPGRRVLAHAQMDAEGLGDLESAPQHRVERRRRLERHRDPLPTHRAPCVLVQRPQVELPQPDGSLDCRIRSEAEHGARQRRLPRARLAEDAEALPRRHGQAHATDGTHRRRAGVGDDQVADIEGAPRFLRWQRAPTWRPAREGRVPPRRR
jgi:hypothetical protein